EGTAAPAKDAAGQDVSRANTAFRYHGDDIRNWPDLSRVRVVVYHNWETSIHRIESVDPATHTVQFTGPAPWPFSSGQRYIVQNAPDTLDVPGEWRFDPHTRTLSYIPRPGEQPNRTPLTVPALEQLLLIQGNPQAGEFVQNVHFQNLTFAYTDTAIGPNGHADGQAEVSLPATVQWTGA